MIINTKVLTTDEIQQCIEHQKEKPSIFFDLRDYDNMTKHFVDAFSNLDYFKSGTLQQLELYYTHNVLSFNTTKPSKWTKKYWNAMDGCIIDTTNKSITLPNNIFPHLDLTKLDEYNKIFLEYNFQLIDGGKTIQYFFKDEDYIKILRYYNILYYSYHIGYTGMNSGTDRERTMQECINYMGYDNLLSKRDIFDRIFDLSMKIKIN